MTLPILPPVVASPAVKAAMWVLIMANAPALPLPKPGADPNAEPPMKVGVMIVGGWTSKAKCEAAGKWFLANFHRPGVCLEQ